MNLRGIDGDRIPGVQLAGPAQASLNAMARKQKRTCNKKKQLQDLPTQPTVTGGEGVAYKPASI